MKNPYATTYCGKDIDLMKPDYIGLSLDTIATHLAKLPRYSGANDGWYSVARHSLIGAKAFHRRGAVERAKQFMLHDAHEAIIGEITTPVANALGKRRVAILKLAHDEAVEKRWNVDLRFNVKPIKEMDAELLYREWGRLMPGDPSKHGIEMPDTTRIPEDLQMMIHGRGTWQNDFIAYINFANFLGLT